MEATRLPCYLDNENPCRYAEATPEELGIWLSSTDRRTPFVHWLRLHRMSPAVKAKNEGGIEVDPSISQAIRELVRDPKTTKTVPVTVEKADGTKWVVGRAEVRIDGDDVSGIITLNAESLINHVTIHDLGSFSFSTKFEGD